MYRLAALEKLRSWMSGCGAEVMIIPSNDCHFGEYVPDYFKVRGWLSGFDGSAGTLVVTASSAALWTDSRYFIQAARQLEGSGIELMKLKMPGTPSIPGWISELYPEGTTVAVDGDLFSRAEYESLAAELKPSLLKVVSDPFNGIWENRPELKKGGVTIVPKAYSGEETSSKYKRTVEKLGAKGRFIHFISALDDIMWLCNIRGTDVEYNPVAFSYCAVTDQGIKLFCNSEAWGDEVCDFLVSQGVELLPYDGVVEWLSSVPADVERIVSKSAITVEKYNALCPEGCVRRDDPTIGGSVAMLKCRKNGVELKGFEKALLNDGIAWVRLLKYIEENLQSGTLNEYNVACKLIELRSESPDYLGESFEPIVAFNANAAAAHYSVTGPDDAAAITPEGFLLMDTGAHYPYGTTDTTRTIALGPLDESQKEDFTLVLKGMIDLAMAIFPANTRGSQLDVLARGPMYRTGKMYFHGTSHGVGHHLCVHESPQIRMEENPIVLDGGMVLSDEPAIYLEGKYGIRTENMVAVVPHMTTEFNQFFRFHTMTLVPIETKAVLFELLNDEEIAWLKSFNERVCSELKPYLNQEEFDWLLRYSTL